MSDNSKVKNLFLKLGIFSLAVIIFLWVYQDPERDDSGSIISSGSIDPLELKAGDCFNDDTVLIEGESTTVYTVKALPCSELHNSEVISAFKSVPVDMISKSIADICFDEVVVFTALDLNDSSLSDQMIEFDNLYQIQHTFTPLSENSAVFDKNSPFNCSIASRDSELKRFSSFKDHFTKK